MRDWNAVISKVIDVPADKLICNGLDILQKGHGDLEGMYSLSSVTTVIIVIVFILKKEKNDESFKTQQYKWASTHSSFKDTVVDVVSATLRAGEGEPLTVFVALLVSQLDRSSQSAISLFLPLILLLSPELTWIQTWKRIILVYNTGHFILSHLPFLI